MDSHGWKGWGYRKIKAKHGWSAQIRANVALALASPPIVTQGTAAVYQAQYTYKGSTCKIKVVVEYGQSTWEVTNGWPEKHIINAYSWKV